MGRLLALVFTLVSIPALAKDLQFWNQTSHEFTGVYLAPVGSAKWGPNQTDNDEDHSVQADERLKIVGVAPGHYDVKLVDTRGQTCIVKDVEVKGTGRVAFAIEESQLTSCTH
jgi:hypothetical protein